MKNSVVFVFVTKGFWILRLMIWRSESLPRYKYEKPAWDTVTWCHQCSTSLLTGGVSHYLQTHKYQCHYLQEKSMLSTGCHLIYDYIKLEKLTKMHIYSLIYWLSCHFLYIICFIFCICFRFDWCLQSCHSKKLIETRHQV